MIDSLPCNPDRHFLINSDGKVSSQNASPSDEKSYTSRISRVLSGRYLSVPIFVLSILLNARLTNLLSFLFDRPMTVTQGDFL